MIRYMGEDAHGTCQFAITDPDEVDNLKNVGIGTGSSCMYMSESGDIRIWFFTEDHEDPNNNPGRWTELA